MTTAKGGRPATGSIGWRRNVKTGVMQWHARITLADGSRSRPIPLDPSIPEDDREHAKTCARDVSARWRARGGVREEVRETVDEYAKRWLEAREGRIASVRDNRGHLVGHILPIIGTHDMCAVTSKQIEDVVAALDRKVRAGELSSKSAKNIWGTCTKLFDDATHAKPAEGLRCLPRDPTDGVRGPDDDGADKLLQFLYPSEVSKFLACTRVPRAWRRNLAIAIYLCIRDGEQRALKWPAVDLEHGVVTVAETFDKRKKVDREGTKSGRARIVPIRPELLPLLKAMHEDARGKGHVCKMPSDRDMARGLRLWLEHAGVTRHELFADTKVNKALRWHDARATGLTWLAVEGKGPTEIRDVAGHTQTSMTDRYMRNAAILRSGRFGEPFPALPPGLIDPALEVSVGVSVSVASEIRNHGKTKRRSAERAGFEGGRVDDRRPEKEAPATDQPSQRMSETEPHEHAHAISSHVEQPKPIPEAVAVHREAAEDDTENATPRPAYAPLRVSVTLGVEDALAHALRAATEAARWEVVAELAKELEARRHEREARTQRPAGKLVRIDTKTRR